MYIYKAVNVCDKKYAETVDIVVSFAVLEHVENPIAFLKEIKSLLKSSGFLLISTPNTDDWLLESMPVEYGCFFYRYAHAWYFNRASLNYICKAARFRDINVVFKQRYDISNALLWAYEHRPTGLGKFEVLKGLDSVYRGFVEDKGISDFIYARMYK